MRHEKQFPDRKCFSELITGPEMTFRTDRKIKLSGTFSEKKICPVIYSEQNFLSGNNFSQ